MIGTPIEPRNVNRHFDKLCNSTGIRRIRFHDLRHSCASLLVSQGVPLDQIQDILGHEDPRTTKTIPMSTSRRTSSAMPSTGSASCSRGRTSDVGVKRGGQEGG
jgi:integrase